MGCPMEKVERAVSKIKSGLEYLERTGNTYVMTDEEIDELAILGKKIINLSAKILTVNTQHRANGEIE